ncbi:MCE family protein [Aeromicrobium sp.]|uniref:MCE family protein n=1 Tax=Aeromicrobium sp. TaxID=1871063 RepID=UPI003D6BEB5E
MTTFMRRGRVRAGIVALAAAISLGGCSFSPYEMPLPGGADLGEDPIEVQVDFRDVLDLVPQSGVRVNDVAVGKVTKVELRGWTARVTLSINKKTELPDDAVATIRQTSLLGEKFVNLAKPEDGGGTGRLSNGDLIPLERSGRNPELEEVFSAAALLLNGGGIEKTNTIVRELGAALDGNEPEVKELLKSSNEFLGQLDTNKESLIVALEKVNRLAVATNNQKAAITNALDDLPEALTVLNNQRDDLVRLMQSLDRLGDVATGVIRRSKADTLANFAHLKPILRELADAGDSLAESFRIVLSFPFTDAIVSNSVSRAMVSCSGNQSNAAKVSEGACYGDYANLDIHLTLNEDQAVNLIVGIISANAPAALAATKGDGSGTNPLDSLPDLPGGLQGEEQGGSTPSPDSGSNDSESDGAPPTICKLTGMCRTPAASFAKAQESDIGRLLVGPAVAR